MDNAKPLVQLTLSFIIKFATLTVLMDTTLRDLANAPRLPAAHRIMSSILVPILARLNALNNIINRRAFVFRNVEHHSSVITLHASMDALMLDHISKMANVLTSAQ
jgi:hypothetical protein